MNDKRVLELWVEAACDPRIIYNFADLVAAETREECAKICDEMAFERSVPGAGDVGCDYVCRGYDNAAQAIRSRS